MSYRLLKHRDYDNSADRLHPMVQRKALWAQVLLGVRGRTPSVKGVMGINAHWRRTPVQGNHFYLWWIPRSESTEVAGWRTNPNDDASTILVHSIRHHDETDEPIDLGAPEDYEEIPLAFLDPRFEEQEAVSQSVRRERVALSTIKGLPGSGKTISLLYLVKDLAERSDLRKVLYITYTQRLKRMARDFFEAQGPEISRRISLRTLSELEAEVTGLSTPSDPFGDLRDFARHVEFQQPGTVGIWRKYPQTLYTELRAHLLGRSFPSDYHLPGGKFEALFRRAPLQNIAAYAADRQLGKAEALLAVRLAERMQSTRFFQDQRAAYKTLEMAASDKLPRWLTELDAIVVDEVQDFTLLQIALLGEIARARVRKNGDYPLIFTVAGDESQIVQPSGFDWGVTKDLLGEQIGLWPTEFEFQHQRRAPRNLARLIDNTWNFYLRLPKQLRPSAKREAFVYGDQADSTSESELGRILLCTPPTGKEAQIQWRSMLTELAAKPGRALIDLTEQFSASHALVASNRPSPFSAPAGANSLPSELEEVLFFAREIKGLERGSVLIYGLEELYQRALRLCEDPEHTTIPLFEARRIFDEMRVALSRSTDKVILLEPATAPILSELALNQIPGVFEVQWSDLLDQLRNEEMTELERIEGMLGEVDELLDRSRWDQAYQRNRRAYELAIQADDFALQREAQEQYVHSHLQEAAHWLDRQEWPRAAEVNQQAYQLAEQFGDPLLIDEVADQRRLVDIGLATLVQRHLDTAADLQRQTQYKRAQSEAMTALTLAESLHLPTAQQTKLQLQIDERLSAISLAWARQVLDESITRQLNGTPELAATLFKRAAQSLARLPNPGLASLIESFAKRYDQVPQRRELNAEQLSLLLDHTRRALATARSQPTGSQPYAPFLLDWLEASFDSLGDQTHLFADWTLLAVECKQLFAYSKLDDRLWELEIRAQALSAQNPSPAILQSLAHFRAIAATHEGDPAESSRAWEQLGEYALAADYARKAGEMERAYNLFRQAKATIPEELAVAVKLLRQLEQLEQKHSTLHPAERQSLLEALARLHVSISGVEDQPNPNGKFDDVSSRAA